MLTGILVKLASKSKWTCLLHKPYYTYVFTSLVMGDREQTMVLMCHARTVV